MLDRQRLRAQVKNILLGNTDAGAAVTSSRVTSWDAEELPAINIVTPSERNNGKAAAHIPAFDCSLTLNIEISVAATDDWDNKLDAICEQVEDLTLKNSEFVKHYTKIASYSTSLTYDEGEIPIATAVIVFELEFTQIFNPIIDADPFARAHVKLPVAPDMPEEDIINARFEVEQGE